MWYWIVGASAKLDVQLDSMTELTFRNSDSIFPNFQAIELRFQQPMNRT